MGGSRRWIVAVAVGVAALVVWPVSAVVDRLVSAAFSLRLAGLHLTSIVDMGFLLLLVLAPLALTTAGVVGATTVGRSIWAVPLALAWIVGALGAALVVYLSLTVLGTFVLSGPMDRLAGH